MRDVRGQPKKTSPSDLLREVPDIDDGDCEDVQRDCLDRIDATRSPDTVIGCLERAIDELQSSTVAVE